MAQSIRRAVQPAGKTMRWRGAEELLARARNGQRGALLHCVRRADGAATRGRKRRIRRFPEQHDVSRAGRTEAQRLSEDGWLDGLGAEVVDETPATQGLK